jgi:hypothetical protein
MFPRLKYGHQVSGMKICIDWINATAFHSKRAVRFFMWRIMSTTVQVSVTAIRLGDKIW